MARTGGARREDNWLVGELAASPQRREVVWYLTDIGGTASFEETVEELATDAERTMTAVRLHHIHLPKLQAAGAVEWDDETGEIQLTSQAREAVDSITEGKLFGPLAGD